MMCAVCMFDGRRQEDLIDLKDGQIDQLRQDLASAQARVAELTDELQMECEARQRVRALLKRQPPSDCRPCHECGAIWWSDEHGCWFIGGQRERTALAGKDAP